MNIHGLQKMTLLDFPEHVACTVFLGGCDFRCPFCHNFELVDGSAKPVMEEEELLAFLSRRQGLLDGVAVTGGEPCLHPDLPELLARIRELGFPVKLDSNGYHPDMLRTLLDQHLVDYIAMDIKNSPVNYARTAGLPEVDMGRIRESISLLMEQAPEYEFRTTVIRELHEEADFHGIGELIRGAEHYYLQPFTDRDSVPFGGFHAPEEEQLNAYADIMRSFVETVRVRGV
ncbi:MAG: anaerobic ribonucleoside-triphosphate reductase activating protein [Parasporobacterium sp.]|nr:anaerobic ribonucleoside-triphosphate reductase activating protein [Parasporobacterium sp.]